MAAYATGTLPTYSRDEIESYYRRIKLPDALRLYTVSEASPKAALCYLRLLQKHHLTHVPFENLSLHYSTHRRNSLHHDDLFKKIVQDGARGGYCMELNAAFGTLLRSLGYKMYAAGARVHDGKIFEMWYASVTPSVLPRPD
jgi:arylamine N-acetyltransferase